MAVRLGRLVTTDKPRLAAPRSNDGHLNYNGEAGRAEAIAVLLSKRVLHEPTALMEIYQARHGPLCPSVHSIVVHIMHQLTIIYTPIHTPIYRVSGSVSV